MVDTPWFTDLFHGTRPARLDIEGVSWGVDRAQPILHPLVASAEPGEVLAIVGPNGAGKSTLLRCLYRFYRPVTGKVRLDGEDIWAMSPRQVARRIATVLQEPASDFGLTVAEVIELGLTPHAKSWNTSTSDYADVEAALALLELDRFASRQFGSLSGGEKQRVMIARALVQRPDVLILDEPTNHLDIRHQLEILELLEALPCTVIVSLHDLALASAHAQKILVLDGGKAAASGEPSKILTPERIRKTFAVETAIDTHPATGRPRFSFHLQR